MTEINRIGNTIVNTIEELSDIGWHFDRIGELTIPPIDSATIRLLSGGDRIRLPPFRLNFSHPRAEIVFNAPNPFSSELDYIPFNNPHVISIKVDTFSITEDEKTCCICMETPHTDKICQTNCQHKFCVDCLTQYTKTKQTCPLCRTLITDISVSTEEICGQLRATI